MLLQNQLRLPVHVLFMSVACLAIGCGSSTEPQGPKPGALQSYLQENPELNVEDDQSLDAEDEFADGDGES